VNALVWRDVGWRPVTAEFATSDGFSSHSDFSHFWRETHGLGLFEGVLIKWGPSK